MSERFVICGGLTPTNRPGSDTLFLDVNAPAGTPQRVNLEMGDLAAPMVDNIPDVLADLLEIAAYVYSADQLTSRGDRTMAKMGSAWRRSFRFQIPIRRPDIWHDNDRVAILSRTLAFLTEDEFSFDFVPMPDVRPDNPYFGFGDTDADALAFEPDEIVLFSGGIDSFAGVAKLLFGSNRRVALVSQQSAPMIASKQNNLVSALRDRLPPNRLFYFPVSINKGSARAVDFTQRSRSFLFAVLGMIVARMFGKDRVTFFENGVVSINLPIVDHVLGARASRTTHPRFLVDCSRLFSSVLGEEIAISNPFLWNTKGEVVRTAVEHDCADLLPDTFSCTRVLEATKTGKHCGTCSQCVDRRFGMLSVGVDEPDAYASEIFRGDQKPGPTLTMVESFVLRAQKLASITQESFLASYGQVFRVLGSIPGPPDVNARRIYELHQRHGKEVVSVVDGELSRDFGLAGALSLSSTSLLSMVVTPIASQTAFQDPGVTQQDRETARPEVKSYQPDVFAIDTAARRVRFLNGPALGGRLYDLVAALVAEFDDDTDQLASKESFRFVSASTLADRLKADEDNIRQLVTRARKALERGFLEASDKQVDKEDFIQTRDWSGYRLNPYLVHVKPQQIDNFSPPSQTPDDVVTPMATDADVPEGA